MESWSLISEEHLAVEVNGKVFAAFASTAIINLPIASLVEPPEISNMLSQAFSFNDYLFNATYIDNAERSPLF